MLAAFTRDWQISAIFSAQSGRPFTPRVSFDNSNSGNMGGGTFAYDRPNVVTGAVPPGVGRPVSYGGQTFAIAPPFTYGNAGRNSLTGPAYASLDAVISRRLLLRPMRTLELRLEIVQRAEPEELSDPRQLRGSRDVWSESVGIPRVSCSWPRASHSESFEALSYDEATSFLVAGCHAGWRDSYARRGQQGQRATRRDSPARFTTLPGFTIERVVPASKLDSYVVITFDSKGRLFVSKEFDHPRLLLDNDNDGVYESEKVFSDKVRNCQGLWFDGPTLWGACAPFDSPIQGRARAGRASARSPRRRRPASTR